MDRKKGEQEAMHGERSTLAERPAAARRQPAMHRSLRNGSSPLPAQPARAYRRDLLPRVQRLRGHQGRRCAVEPAARGGSSGQRRHRQRELQRRRRQLLHQLRQLHRLAVHCFVERRLFFRARLQAWT